MSGEIVCNICRREVCNCYVTLSTAQRVALAEADDGGYRAIGSGRVRTARHLESLGLVEIRPWNNWVAITPAGRSFLHALAPSPGASEESKP